MIKELLKPLEWQGKKPAEGESYRALAVSPVTRYVITDDGRKVKVIYHNFTEDEPAKTKPGFSSVAEAKDWVQGEHYPSKMAKWFEPDWSERAVTPYVRKVFAKWARTDPLTDTVNWFKVAKPEPTIEDECVQQGVMFEEMYELLDALGLSESDAGRGLKHLAYLFKTKQPYAIKLLSNLTHEQRIERLDAMCDIVVTAAGSSYTSKDDFIGALTEVNASNWSKFENGKAVTDDNGKIIKGSGYFKPELDKFVGSHVIEEVVTGGIKLTVTKNSDGSVHFKSCVEGDYE